MQLLGAFPNRSNLLIVSHIDTIKNPVIHKLNFSIDTNNKCARCGISLPK